MNYFRQWMNEWIAALCYNPNKATYSQGTLAIPRCSVNCELGTLQSGQVNVHCSRSRTSTEIIAPYYVSGLSQIMNLCSAKHFWPSCLKSKTGAAWSLKKSCIFMFRMLQNMQIIVRFKKIWGRQPRTPPFSGSSAPWIPSDAWLLVKHHLSDTSKQSFIHAIYNTAMTKQLD
jgi:hypothetical protein